MRPTIAQVRRLLLIMLTASLAACASTDVAPIDAGDRPSDKSTDEAGLWLQVERFEADLKTSAVVVRDEALNDYVRNVTCNVTGTEYCSDLRVYIIDAPIFNASMFPNGLMMVNTGLLLRAENEAQLAFVLGHEFAHYRERHSLQRWRAQTNAANASLIFALAVGAAGVPDAAVLGDLALAGRLFGFTRDQEREADDEGLKVMVAAGYDGRESYRLWRAIIDEVEASSSERKKRRFARASLFSTHPLSTERVETLKAQAGDVGGEVGLMRHRAAIRPYLEQWLDTDITRRDMGEHFFLIRRLQDLGLDEGVLSYRLGEAYRVRREEGDQALAAGAYAAATTYPDAPAAAYRELGNGLRRSGDADGAMVAYRRYLELAPAAADRALVEQFLSAG